MTGLGTRATGLPPATLAWSSPVQFLGGAFILSGVAMVRLDELRPSRAPGGSPRPTAQQPELAPSRAPGR